MPVLFKIGNTDLTQYEDKTKHDVNRDDLFSSWTDGNWVEHREIVRTRVQGSVVLSFPRAAAYADFLTLLTNSRDANGYYPVTVWCSNTNTNETIDAFLTLDGETKWDVTCPVKWQGITVGIYQR